MYLNSIHFTTNFYFFLLKTNTICNNISKYANIFSAAIEKKFPMALTSQAPMNQSILGS